MEAEIFVVQERKISTKPKTLCSFTQVISVQFQDKK